MTPRKIIKRLGGQSAVARLFGGISRQAVNQWVMRNKIPPDRMDYLRENRPDAFK